MREQIEHRTGRLTLRLYQSTRVLCHWHDEMEFILPVDAPCSCFVDSKPITVEVGQALLIHPRQLHTLSCDTACRVVVFHPAGICGAELISFFPPERRFRMLYDQQDGELMQALRALFDTPDGYGKELMLKARMLHVLGLLVAMGEYRKADQTPSPFADVLIYTQAHACERLTLEEVARQTHFSVSYISHAFRRYTGQSFSEFVNDCRLQRAALMLRDRECSVLEVALACGFESVSYFIKRFKACFGVTPHQYRT